MTPTTIVLATNRINQLIGNITTIEECGLINTVIDSYKKYCPDDKKIIQEMGDVDEDKFMKMFEYATAEPFGFLFIDFNAKSPEQQFRKNFDEYLT